MKINFRKPQINVHAESVQTGITGDNEIFPVSKNSIQ